MKDTLPFIAGLLADMADTELAFPDCFTKLPCIVLTETDNSSSVVLSGRDRYSIITLQLDLYDNDEENVRKLSERVNGTLAALGVRRVSSQFITDEDLPRMCMRYRFGLDEATGRTVTI